MGRECQKLAREAAAANQGYEQYLLGLTELEVAARHANALRTRIKQAGFPGIKDLDSFDFTATPTLNKQKVLELTRHQWIDEHRNARLIGNAGTGKTHVAIALGLAACRHGKRVRFFAAAHLVNQLEEAQKQYQLDRFLARLDKVDLMIWAISRSAARAPSFCSRFLPTGTNGPASWSPATCRSPNGSRSSRANA